MMINFEYVWLVSAIPVALLSGWLTILIAIREYGAVDKETTALFMIVGSVWPIVVALIFIVLVGISLWFLCFYIPAFIMEHTTRKLLKLVGSKQ